MVDSKAKKDTSNKDVKQNMIWEFLSRKKGRQEERYIAGAQENS